MQGFRVFLEMFLQAYEGGDSFCRGAGGED